MSNILSRIVRGYWNGAKRVSAAVVVLAAVAAASAAFVYPLWYLATRYRTAYTVLFLSLSAGSVIVLLVRRSVRRTRHAAHPVRAIVTAALRIAGKSLLTVFSIVALYWIVVAFGAGMLAVALPASVLYLFGVGYLVYGRTRRSKRAGA